MLCRGLYVRGVISGGFRGESNVEATTKHMDIAYVPGYYGQWAKAARETGL